MNYRIIATYVFILGFFGFLAFAYINYSQETTEKVANEKFLQKDTNIEEVVKRVIRENPEEIIHSLEAYQAKKMEEAMHETKKRVQTKLPQIGSFAGDPRIGDRTSKIKVIEFFDINCGYCKRMAPITAKILEENPDIEYIFKELPILGEQSVLAAKADLAVFNIDQEKFKTFHTAILGLNSPKTEENLVNLAGSVGIDIEKFKTALKDPKLNEVINVSQSIAKDIMLQGTPAYIIDGELIPGLISYEEFKGKIEEAREKYGMTVAPSGTKVEHVTEQPIINSETLPNNNIVNNKLKK